MHVYPLSDKDAASYLYPVCLTKFLPVQHANWKCNQNIVGEEYMTCRHYFHSSHRCKKKYWTKKVKHHSLGSDLENVSKSRRSLKTKKDHCRIISIYWSLYTKCFTCWYLYDNFYILILVFQLLYIFMAIAIIRISHALEMIHNISHEWWG